MNLFWPIVTALAALITIITWIRNNLKEKPKQIIYPLLLVTMTSASTWMFNENRELKSIKRELETIKKEATDKVSSWPDPDRVEFCSKGERIGIILGGMVFLEKHKQFFPETYLSAKNLIEDRANSFKAPIDREKSYDEYQMLEDTTSAMIKLIETISR